MAAGEEKAMPGKPDPTSLAGRLLSGLTYSSAYYRGIGTRGIEYLSRFERRGSSKILYTIYSGGAVPHSEVFVQKDVTRLNFKTPPANPPKGSPALDGSAGKWPGQGIDVGDGNFDACRKLLMAALGKRATAKPAKAAAKPVAVDQVASGRAAS